MEKKHHLTPEEISALVNRITDEFEYEDRGEGEMLAKIPPGERWLVPSRKAETVRDDLRNKLRKDFPELSLPEINMKLLRSLTPVRLGKHYSEPAYCGWLC